MLNRKDFLESLMVLAEDEEPMTVQERRYFYNLYKELMQKVDNDDKKFKKIAEAVSKHKIDPVVFRNTMAHERLIELTPRQSQIYLYTVCIVILSKGI
jgi:hypothetical protein